MSGGGNNVQRWVLSGMGYIQKVICPEVFFVQNEVMSGGGFVQEVMYGGDMSG